MEKRWILKEADEGLVALLSERLKVSPLVARILVHRGFRDPEEGRRFLSSSLSTDLPSPFLMAGMEEAAERLARALRDRELLCIWGDYDVDGTTGAAVLVSFLKEVGGNPVYYIPHRIGEGYGLNAEALRQLISQGVRLVVSVDCGISNRREVELARELGIDVIIVDHHVPPPELPPALSILNPHRLDCSFPDKGLSGAGLAFYLVIGLRAKLRSAGWFSDSGTPDIRRYLDIVTLGTIADLVPLRGVNRIFARRGLRELSTSTRPGVVALKQAAGIAPGEVSVGQVAFQLGPRINAAGRMDAGLKVVEMLTTDSPEVASRIAQELDGHNRERRATEAAVLEEALRQVDSDPAFKERYSIVVGRDGWHPGVLGIVASRIVEKFHRPTIVVGFERGEGKGSGRSIRGFHLVEGLRQCADLLEKFGGHEFAGGLSIKQEKLPIFLQRFEAVVKASLAPADLVPILEVDALLEFSEISLPLFREIEALRPFGIGNPEPLFMTLAVEVSERRDFNGGSRFRLRQKGRSLDAVAFSPQFRVSSNESRDEDPARLGTLNSILTPGTKVDVVYRLSENVWEGLSAVELRIVDARPSE